MRVGYGLRRKPADFADAKIDRVYIDSDSRPRPQRDAMIDGGLAKGDTLVLLATSDLSSGVGLLHLREDLERIGVVEEVWHVAARSDLPKNAGRPRLFMPSATQAAILRPLWENGHIYQISHVLRTAGEVMGHPVSAEQLRYYFHSGRSKKVRGAAGLSKERRSEIAQRAAAKRWGHDS